MKSRPLMLGLLLVCASLGCSSTHDTPRAAEDPVPQLKDPYTFFEAQSKARWAEPRRTRFNIEYHKIEGLSGNWSWHVAGDRRMALWPSFINRDIEELDKSRIYEVDAIAFNDDYQGLQLYVYGYKDVGDAGHRLPEKLATRDSSDLETLRRVMRVKYMQMLGSWVAFSWPAVDDMKRIKTDAGERWIVELDTADQPGGFPEQLILDITFTGGHTGQPKVESNPYATR